MNDPSDAVDVLIDELNTPPLNSCISTLPVKLSVQVIICELPMRKLSPPFGEVTVTWLPIIVKLASEKSKIDALSILVIFTV